MGACHSFTQIRLVGRDVTVVWMQGAAQRKVQAQLGVVGALRGAVAQDELEAENQRLRAELDTERRTRSGRQLLVEPEAPPEMVAPQPFADPAALVRTASMSQAASYHVRHPPPTVISGHLCSLTKPVSQPPPAPPSSARAAQAPAQGSFTAGEEYWAVPDGAPQPTPPADRSQRYLSP